MAAQRSRLKTMPSRLRPFAHALALLCCSASWAQAPADWNAQAQWGRDLYYGVRHFAHDATVSGAALAATASACVRCHGALGQGSREGNFAAPDVRVSALQQRDPDFSHTLLKAMQSSLGSGARPLSVAMPRYTPTDEESNALRSFWPWLGSAAQPQTGVSDHTLRLGVMLAGLTRTSARQEVLAGVQAVFERTNAAGGVHGRRLELVSNDDTPPSNVFALIASTVSPSQAQRLAQQRIPVIAGIDMPQRTAPGDGWQLPLLPSFDQQIEAALAALDSNGSDCIRWTYDPEHWAAPTASPAQQNHSHAPPWPRGTRVCVAALAPAAQVDALRAQWRNRGVALVRLIELSGMRQRPLVEQGMEHHLILSMPVAVAHEAERQQRSLWHVLGQASARIAVETLSRSGRVLAPEWVLAQARTLTGFEPLPGAPLAYSRSAAHGWTPAHFVQPPDDTETHRRKELP